MMLQARGETYVKKSSGLGRTLERWVSHRKDSVATKPAKSAGVDESAIVITELSLIHLVESITRANEMALISACFAMGQIREQARATGVTLRGPLKLETWAQCARAVLATTRAAEDVKHMLELFQAPLGPHSEVKQYLWKLTALALEQVVANWKGSAALEEPAVLQRYLASRGLSLLHRDTSSAPDHLIGDQTAIRVAARVLTLVSTNVIGQISTLDRAGLK
jgi:hypothetical protein